MRKINPKFFQKQIIYFSDCRMNFPVREKKNHGFQAVINAKGFIL
jgi:hypothetical protein